MAEGGAADAETQRGEIATLLKTPLRRADTWYLVDSRWFKQWKKYVGFDSWDKYQMGDQNVYPGPVDNSGLLTDGDVLGLKQHLIDELDYMLLPADGWNKLLSWYGLREGQQPIARKVVEQGMFVKHCKVEVYLTELKLCEDSNMENVVTRRFSKADTIDSIEQEMRKLFSIPDEKETRLWNRYMSNTFEPLNKPDSTIQDAGLYQGQVLVIEQKNEDGTWPRGSSALNMKSSSYSLPSYPPYSSSSYECSDPGRRAERAGLCGLSNLGNTCFMNSATQCLSNIPPLTEYFLKDQHQDELNQDNLLGMKGEIAKAYAELIKQLWSGKCSYVTPRPFKTQVGQFAPQFSGYQQQDSHELLAFLLDGLHEDLNRIRKKPYIQLMDADGRPDKVVAEEAWENHIKRNDSIIVDIFHGLFKSTLVCPECSKISVTFDPFCYLTLPLPTRKERSLEVYLVWLDPLAKPTQYKLTVPKVGCISDLCASLSALSGVPAEKMVVTDIYNHRFHRIFSSNENLSSIMDRDDIYVFEVAVSRLEDTQHVLIPVHLREKYKQSGFNHTSTPLFGQPFLLSVPRSVSEDKLYNLLLLRLWYLLARLTAHTLLPHHRSNRLSHTSHNPLHVTLMPYDLTYLHFLKSHCSSISDFDKHESMEYKPQKKSFFKLKDCIELFTTKEKLGADDPWYCPDCKQHQQATKKLDLWSVPPVLVVHLKRFSYSRYMRDKLDSLVDFPLRDLDMSEFLINPSAGPSRYDLIAVSNHYGGMGGGHYTAYAKNKEDQKWYNFDDSSVSPSSEEQTVSKAAYVLFYQRQDTVKGTGYFSLDLQAPDGDEASAGAQSEEDLNDNQPEEELGPSRDVSMSSS
uniref:Ubiquitin carboxyl-terminal hydrolase 15 n=1 Tax=Sinocyclocheilus rhinocerous TaxID=307959 RepID=A0A673HVD6_9TELE